MTDETTNRGWYLDGDGDLQFANPGHVTDGDFITRSGQVCFYGPESFDALVALVRAAESAPTAPADDLPPGVERISDGTYICRGIDIPEGWGFYGPAESISASEDESRPWWDWRDRETDVRTGNVYYQVRPVTPAEPATEWVPWWEALNAELPLVEWGGQVIKNAQRQHSGVFLSTWGLFPVIRVDADGRVEVQR